MTPNLALGDRILKVNHAGEHGAICLYTGQILLATVTARAERTHLLEYREHERRHRNLFNAELKRRGVKRCRSYWLCGTGGFTLGLITGLFGTKAVCATTSAVEEVVLRHLTRQIEALGQMDPAAVVAIEAIIADEQQHHDRSTARSAGSFWDTLLRPVVAGSTEFVIWLGMRL